jgi:hypothetical protein
MAKTENMQDLHADGIPSNRDEFPNCIPWYCMSKIHIGYGFEDFTNTVCYNLCYMKFKHINYTVKHS